jgi:hypothetical protein
MRRILSRRPSPAIIIAIVALVVALGGTAIAGGGFITKKKFNSRLNAAISTTLRGPLTYSTVTTSVPVTPAGGAGTNVAAPCPPGTQPTGGGIKLSDEVNEFVNDSHVTSTGWAGVVVNLGTLTHSAQVTAICAVVSATAGSRPPT